MRVLHVNAGLETGGGLFHIVNLLSQAKKEGQDFELLTLADGPVAEAARKQGIKTHVLGAKSRYDLASLRRLVKFVNDGNFDIVHSHGARANLYLDLVHRRLHAQWVITVHSDPLQDFADRGFLGKTFTKLNVASLHHCDMVLAITHRFAELLTNEAGVEPSKIRVIYNGIAFHDDIPAKFPHPFFNIVNVARFEKIKGQALLLRALKQVGDPNIHLHLAGSGSQEQALRDLVRDLDLGEQVIFHGFLSHEELTQLYRKMDAAILASYSESFPLVLLEGADHLLPLISTNVGDMHTMIPDADHGLVVPVADQDKLAGAIKQMAALPASERSKMAQVEKDYLVEHFSLHEQLAAILHDYDLLRRRG
jgi:glycosyltransferase involved in cell wall biosynthesis